MGRYDVTLHDGRVINVISDSAERAEKQASHQERTRIQIATKRGIENYGPDPSSPASVTKVKD